MQEAAGVSDKNANINFACLKINYLLKIYISLGLRLYQRRVSTRPPQLATAAPTGKPIIILTYSMFI